MAAEQKDPRKKLNLNAPLLSTRRPPNGATATSNATSHVKQAASWDHRVPFSWELSAGKPKNVEAQVLNDEFFIPPPCPPPGRARKLVENEYDGDDDFSDAIDTFSLSAAIDMVESAELAERSSNMLDGVRLDSSEMQSPSFIIQRFLTDAKDLAISSGLPIPKSISNQAEKCKPQVIEAAPKGCGLGFDGFWRTKHKPPCGVKSPVRVTSASVKSQWGWKPKPK